MAEQIVSKAYRILTDVQDRVWSKISFWTKARDVEFENGYNANTTLNEIYGITDDISANSSNQAASIKAVNEVDSNTIKKIEGEYEDGNYTHVDGIGYDEENKKLLLKVGADTVIPFNGGGEILIPLLREVFSKLDNTSGSGYATLKINVENYTKLSIEKRYTYGWAKPSVTLLDENGLTLQSITGQGELKETDISKAYTISFNVGDYLSAGGESYMKNIRIYN